MHMDFKLSKKDMESLKRKLYCVGAGMGEDAEALALGAALGVTADGVKARAAVSAGCIARRIDAYVLDYLNNNPYGVVIDVENGVSTRFGRIDNGKCGFCEVTTKDVRAFKVTHTGYDERHTYVISTPDNLRWITGAPDAACPLIILEGVLDKFNKQDVLVLLKRLRERYDDAYLLLDHYTEGAMRFVGAKWGMDNPSDLCAYVTGLRYENGVHIGADECIQYLSGAGRLWLKMTDALEMSKYAKTLSFYRFYDPAIVQEL